MAQTIKDLKVFEAKGQKKLLEELVKNTNVGKSIIIVGEAGIGKTHIMREYDKIEGFDKCFEIRVAGMAAEDMLGIPVRRIDPESGKEVTEFAKLNWMQYIKDHPKERVLLILDELNRGTTEIEAGLFNILEQKIDGEYYPNLQVVACINHGANYETNIEFTDVAFRRRTLFIKYSPAKTDAIDFMAKNNYHPLLVKAYQKRDILQYDINFKDEEDYCYEQPTTYGSYFSFDARLKNCAKIKGLKKNIGKTIDGVVVTEETFHHQLPILDVVTELRLSYRQYFNERIGKALITVFQDMLTLKDLDVIKQVIAKGKIPAEVEQFREDIFLRCKNELVKNPLLMKKYTKKIKELFRGKFDYLAQVINDISNNTQKYEAENKALTHEAIVDMLTDFVSEGLSDKELDQLESVISQHDDEENQGLSL